MSRWISLLLLVGVSACQNGEKTSATKGVVMASEDLEVNLSEEEWRKRLSPQEYNILREKGTERAFSGEYTDNKKEGTYTCAGCANELFSSKSKYDSRSGWPSYYQPIDPEKVTSITDNSHGMTRTEVVCARCGGHLGHVFPDGPKPTGDRYCINSASLDFEPSEKE